MARVSSNHAEMDRFYRALGDTLDFTRPGRQASLGKDALATVTIAIGDRCREGQAPGGGDWAPNKPWAARDHRKAGKPTGYLTGEMLSPLELAGRQDITRNEATATYGTNEETRQRAEWFSEGGPNQEPRAFYEMDESTDAALDAFLDAEVDRYLGGL